MYRNVLHQKVRDDVSSPARERSVIMRKPDNCDGAPSR